MANTGSDEQSEEVQRIVDQLAEQGWSTEPQTEDQWAFLIDPGWQPESPDDGVPLSAIVGGWLVSVGEGLSRFHPNPDYEPTMPGSPTDPVDATMQLAGRGEMTSEKLFSVIKESIFAVALDEEENPVVAPSPDDVPSLLVTTAPLHRGRVQVDNWMEVDAEQLAGILTDRGVDLLLNPGAPSSMRLIGEIFAQNITA